MTYLMTEQIIYKYLFDRHFPFQGLKVESNNQISYLKKKILISKVQFIRTINRTDFRTVRFTNIFILYEKINNKSFRKGWSSSPALYYHYNLGMTKVQIQTFMSKIHLGNIINSNLFDCFNLDYRNGLSSSIVYEAHRDCTNSSHTIYYNY